MKRFLRYMYDFRGVCIWAVLSGAVFAAVFALYGIRMEAAWYPILITALFGVIMLAAGFVRYDKRRRNMERILSSDGIFPDAADILPKAESLEEEDYHELLGKMEAAFRKKKGEWDASRRDMDDYYATWVHQIKAPIAVMKVMLQQEDTPENRELSAELFRVEQYAEMALCYVRLGEGASDLVIQEYALDTIIRKAVRKYAGQFIRRRIRLVYEGTAVRVITDEKWLSFIIEQLLSNAVKYTSEGSVTIAVKDGKKLSVTDTGIGISPEDMPRIFEKGYTGYNGRLDKKSTGIGLYLCRKAAEKLGHVLTAESEPGKGSRFTIDLESYPFRAE
ncbi:sensor histidine kinase [[Ruminococcus] torques]|uniref:sensor histidine kinase n=1 Tax=[Ruminococcus] torques TaxID=33039 RepID=UPI0025A3E623|nr:sensor histidine kinase [[Ruminococcus] torques]MDM8236098.1 sensor histidine kinase [[Ruminococcus] torques]